MQSILVAGAVYLTITVLLAHSQTPAPASNATPKPLTWDVISVKPNHSLNNSGSMSWPSDELELRNMTLGSVILSAFEIKSNNQLVGLPDWVSSEHFDIQAKMDAETSAAFHSLDREKRHLQSHLLFRRILEDRFGLKFHIEKRDLPVYNLVVAKRGPTLKEAARGCPRRTGRLIRRPGKAHAPSKPDW